MDKFENEIFSAKHEISSKLYYAVLLHEHPEYINECCELINLEWKRSHEARVRSISGSSCNFPTSVLLIQEAKKPKIIGHCKLTKITPNSRAIFIQTVVIHPDYRGRGLGKLLMTKAEIYLKCKNIKWVYLSTLGQEIFYEKLGYKSCEPISIYGGKFDISYNNNNDFEPDEDMNENSKQFIQNDKSELVISNGVASISLTDSNIPPPPPMPSLGHGIVNIINRKTFMRKRLT